MSFKRSEAADRYRQLQGEIEPLLFLARDSDLQAAAVKTALAFADDLERNRLAAITASDEEAANDFLGLISVLRSWAFEMTAYILLKQNEPEKAWDALINAQNGIMGAARASAAFTNLAAKFEHLRDLERYLFPPQTFLSSGFIASSQHCSICQAEYEACDHIAGRPYMGRFCNIEIKGLRLDHVAFVEVPADRRCRVKSHSVPGGIRNQMTWVVSPKPEDMKGSMEVIAAIATSG